MSEAFKNLGGFYVPATTQPDRVGLGCPRCDDHELVPFSVAAEPAKSDAIQRFLRRHADCGSLEQLEQYGSRVGITGVLDPRGAS